MELGIIGLGRMGGNIGLRLMKAGHKTVVHDRSADAVAGLEKAGAKGVGGLADMVKAMAAPRAIWVMLPAGKITEDTVHELAGMMDKGDTIIDGGNSYYKDDIRRAKLLKEQGLTYVDVGTSGGVWGMERGYCMMIGGDKEAVDRLDPIFKALAPGIGTIDRTPGRDKFDARAEQGYLHCGPAGSGHFVKMVHNGIEYGMMQAYAEGFDILHNKSSEELPEDERFTLNMPDIAEVWRRGSVVASWLLDLSAIALAENETLSNFEGAVADSGEGRWTVEAAIEEAVPAPVLSASLFARFRSRREHTFADKLLSAMRRQFGGHAEGKVEGVTAMDMQAPMPGRLRGTEGLATAKPAPPVTLVIFGAAGDLTRRLLTPSLYNLALQHLLDDKLQVIGVDHNEGTDESYRDKLTEAMQSFVGKSGSESEIGALNEDCWAFVRDRLFYQVGEYDQTPVYQALKQRLQGNVVFYLAAAARFFAPIIGNLADAGLMQESEGAFRRVVVEKPFGHDLPSAEELNKLILERMGEGQVFRIDHFLGKETVQNIMALRFSNGIFEPLWNRQYIDHVQITAAETVGVEGRGSFYEQTGALRDMVPNHMFQLMATVAMEPPNTFDADAVRAEKAKVLEAIKPFDAMRVNRDVVRGQYVAGRLGEDDVPGYRQEPNVDRASRTETFVAMRLKIDNFRWAGVPFYIRTGKRLAVRRTEIAIHFKQAPYAMFRDTPVDRLTPNVMVLHIQPSEGITINLSAKIPGPKLKLGGVAMDFRYSDYFKAPSSTGYETLLYDVMMGDPTLFQRADMVEAGWAAVQPILDEWGSRQGAVHPYYAGSHGPEAADRLLSRDGRHWLQLP